MRRTRTATVLALAGAALAVALALADPAYGAGVTTASVLTSTRAAINSQSGVHVAFTASSGTTGKTERIAADVGQTSGSETVTEGTAEVAIRITPTHAYVSGNRSGLITLFGLSAGSAKKLGHKWETWRAGTTEYNGLRSDVTMASVTDLLPKAKGTVLARTTSDGTPYLVLRWTTAKTASTPKLTNTLTITASGLPLPAAETGTATGGAHITTMLSRWNEDVTVSAPPASSTMTSSQVGG
jgi:hypothetical protein